MIISNADYAHWVQLRADQAIREMYADAPDGIGGWEEAWERVAEADSRLVRALVDLEEGRGDRIAARDAGGDLVAVWKDVIRDWKKQQTSGEQGGRSAQQ